MVTPVLSFLGFYHENMFEFIKFILFVYWHNPMNTSLLPFIYFYIYWCAYVESYLYSWEKGKLIMMDRLLTICLYLICKNFIEIICI